MILLGFDRELVAWSAARGHAPSPPCIAIGVAHKGQIVAAAIYNEYRPPNIHVTFVTSSPRWASPGAIKTILRYPFLQLGCKRVTAVTTEDNVRARAFLLRLGFSEEGIHPDLLPDGTAVSYGLLKREAGRWID